MKRKRSREELIAELSLAVRAREKHRIRLAHCEERIFKLKEELRKQKGGQHENTRTAKAKSQ